MNFSYVIKKFQIICIKYGISFLLEFYFGFFENLNNSNIMFSLLYPKMNH